MSRLQRESLERTGRYGPYEKEFIHKDGRLVPVRLQGQIIERHGEKFVWSSAEDITERKQMDEERQQAVDRLRKTLGATVHALAVTAEVRDPYT